MNNVFGDARPGVTARDFTELFFVLITSTRLGTFSRPFSTVSKRDVNGRPTAVPTPSTNTRGCEQFPASEIESRCSSLIWWLCVRVCVSGDRDSGGQEQPFTKTTDKIMLTYILPGRQSLGNVRLRCCTICSLHPPYYPPVPCQPFLLHPPIHKPPHRHKCSPAPSCWG